MCNTKKPMNKSFRSFIAGMDHLSEIHGQTKLSTLLGSLQLPADLTVATEPEYKAILSGVGKMSEYSLKCLILLENNLIDQHRCDFLCQMFDVMSGFRPSTVSEPIPKGPANDPEW